MKALLLKETPHPATGYYQVQIEEIPTPKPQPGSVLIKLSAAALNHRDVWMTEGLYPGLQFDSTLGADGAGTVIDAASESDKKWIGKNVLINSSYFWGADEARPSKDFKILGSKPLPGTLAQFIVAPIEQIALVPPHLSLVQAAAIPLAGLTAYRSVFSKGEVAKGKRVLVTGIGGGVALFAMQFAVAVGAKVFVTSSSDEKIKRAIQLGAAGGANYTQENWNTKILKEAGGLFDTVVDGSAGDSLNVYLKMLNVGGILSLYGSTAGNGSILLPLVFLKNIDIRGVAMGTPKEFNAMMKLIEQTKLVPVVDSVRPFAQAPEAFEEMRKGKQFGKLVIDVGTKAAL